MRASEIVKGTDPLLKLAGRERFWAELKRSLEIMLAYWGEERRAESRYYLEAYQNVLRNMAQIEKGNL